MKSIGHKTIRGRDQYRKKLLAKVHIAKKDLGLDEYLYRHILISQFRVDSAKKLDNRGLEQLVALFVSKGWRPKKKQGAKGTGQSVKYKSQATALKERARDMLDQAIKDGLVHSSRGLVKKICGVDNLEWCGDAVRLKKLLAVLNSIGQGAGSKE